MEENKFAYLVEEQNNSMITICILDEYFNEKDTSNKVLYTEEELKDHIAKYTGLCCFFWEEEVQKEAHRIRDTYGVDSY